MNQIMGFGTTFINSGQALDGGGRVQAVGEEVLSPYWLRANTNRPVSVRMIASFHSQGDPVVLRHHNKGSTTTTTLFTSAGEDAQTLFPQNSALTGPAQGTFTPGSTPFGFRVDNEWSDPTRNVQEQPGGGYGHHLRFFPLRNTDGNLIPDTYLLIMDYEGINYDYNDNIYIISNVRPETPGGALPAGLGPVARGASLPVFSTTSVAKAIEDADEDELLA
jgi:hypothetical protein